jgi:uncharacterized protein
MKSSTLDHSIRIRFREDFSLIQVILGPRQVGKTTAILSFLESYKGSSHYVSAEESTAPTSDWLDQVWSEAKSKSPSCLLVIDEIQKVANWSERIKSLWDAQERRKGKQVLRLILLGSSSNRIQEGLSESLTGRFELIRAYHWSFAETQLLAKMDLTKYLKFGGYPGAYKMLKNERRFTQYLRDSIINTVIEKDLLTQSRVKNVPLFRQTFQLLQSLPAIEISYSKMLGQLQDKGNTELVKNYLDLYEGAYLITQIHKYNKSSFKTRLSTPKIVCMAPALLDSQQKETPEFLGRCFESLVGADLIRAQLPVTYWRDGDYEIDFVVELKGLLFGIEVKSGKRKSSKSVSEFRKKFPKAIIAYINFDNYSKFALNPEKYLLDVS